MTRTGVGMQVRGVWYAFYTILPPVSHYERHISQVSDVHIQVAPCLHQVSIVFGQIKHYFCRQGLYILLEKLSIAMDFREPIDINLPLLGSLQDVILILFHTALDFC